jgi:CO/xanthine dehydrogenase FAD-binding subunit
MLPKLKQYHRPETPEAALALLRQDGAVPLAGGTTVLAAPDERVEQVVDLQALTWREIAVADGWLRLGSLVTLAEIESSAVVAGPASDLLRQAAHRAGPNTFRNAATVGGLIASRPAVSDLLAVLLVLGAELELAGAETATCPLEAYPSSPLPGLIAAVRVPWPLAGAGALEAVGRTPADAPIVHVAAWAGPAGVRVAAGGVGPRVLRLAAAEAALAAAPDVLAAAVGATMSSVDPVGDFRGTAEYRRAMVGVLLRRALAACIGSEA